MKDKIVITKNQENSLDKLDKEQVILGVLSKISPETINNILQTFTEVIRTNNVLRENEQEFLHKIEELRLNTSKNINKMQVLATILCNSNLTEENQNKLVNTICELASK